MRGRKKETQTTGRKMLNSVQLRHQARTMTVFFLISDQASGVAWSTDVSMQIECSSGGSVCILHGITHLAKPYLLAWGRHRHRRSQEPEQDVLREQAVLDEKDGSDSEWNGSFEAHPKSARKRKRLQVVT
jgi:hypothetical protein